MRYLLKFTLNNLRTPTVCNMYPLDDAIIFMTSKTTLTPTGLKNASVFVEEYGGARSMEESGKEPWIFLYINY